MSIITSTNDFELWQPKEETSSKKKSVSNGDTLIELQKSISIIIVDYLNNKFTTQIESDYRKKSYLTKLSQYNKLVEPNEYLIPILNHKDYYLAVHYSSDFCQQYIDLYYGGKLQDNPSDLITSKEILSEFDIYALEHLTQNITADWLQTLNLKLTPKSELKSEQEENISKNIPSYICQTHFKTKPNNFYISFILSEKVVNSFLEKNKSESKKTKTISIKNACLELNAIAFRTKVDLAYILALKQGDLIQIDTKDHIKMQVNNKDLLTGTLGHINQQQAVKINTKLQEPMDIT